MALENLAQEKMWLDKSKYTDAECVYYVKQSKKCKTLKDKNAKVKSVNITNCEDCFMCDIITEINLHNDVSKLLEKVQQWDKNEKNDSKMYLNQYKQINKFECLVCSFKTIQFNDWKCHIMSVTHIAKSHRVENVCSYVCFDKKCKLVLYGSQKSLNEHNVVKHSYHCIASGISILMAEVMKQFLAANQSPIFFCSHCKKFKNEPIHTSDIIPNIGIKIPIEYYCRLCRVQFLSSQEMIDYHFLSVEHMTLKCFDELCSKAKMNSKIIKFSEELTKNNEHNLSGIVQNVFTTNSENMPNIILTKSPTTVMNNKKKTKKRKKKKKMSTDNIKTIKPNITQDVPLSQKHDDITSEHPQNLQPNKSITNFGYDGTTLLDNIQKVQKPFVNNNFLEELIDDVQNPNNKSNGNMKLAQNHSKHHQEYTNFFKNKIILLKKLRQYEDLVMKTLSYYCDVCDFITVEKYVWDKHNQTAHPIDINRSTVYCSTCAMFVCGNDQEHNSTIEHSSLLNFLPLLKPVEVLKEKNSYVQFVKISSDENYINLEKEEKTELNHTDCFKGSTYLNDDSCKTSDCSIMKEPCTNGKDQAMKNTILLLEKTDNKYEHKQDDINTSNAEKLIHSGITSTSNSLPNTLITIPYQGNVLVEKMPEDINCIDLSTDDLINVVENDSTLIVKSQNKIISNLGETICPLYSPLTDKTQIFENIKVDELDKDQLYGEYVVQRLKNINNTSIKQLIKLEIDNIFYTNMKLLLSQESER